MKSVLLFHSLVATAAIICGCGDTRSSPETGKVRPPAATAVHVIQPKRGEISRWVSLPGNVHAFQQATLYAKTAGYLKSIAVDKGDRVKAGDVLAEIESPELLADEAKLKAELAVTEITLKRATDAQQKAPDLVVPQTIDDARGKFEIAQGNFRRNETLLGYTKIVAPFSGVITRRWVDAGAFIPSATSGSVAQSAAVVMLMDFNSVRIEVAVPEPEVPSIKNELSVVVRGRIDLACHDLKVRSVRVDEVIAEHPVWRAEPLADRRRQRPVRATVNASEHADTRRP